MNKVYIIVFSSNYDTQLVKDFLDTQNSIEFWFENLPNTLFVKTSLDSKAICEMIQEKFGLHRIFVSEINTNYWGRLPEDHWSHFGLPPIV